MVCSEPYGTPDRSVGASTNSINRLLVCTSTSFQKSRTHLVYEWSNYRLACAAMNSYKGEYGDVLDPFELQDGWFALELVEFQVVTGAGLVDRDAERVRSTIRRLHLNGSRFCRIRAEFAEARWRGDITAEYLARHSPFVARELRRQGRMNG